MKQLAYDNGLSKKVEIHGKDYFPQNGEFAAEMYLEKIAKFIGINYEKTNISLDNTSLPPRLPLLCPGCSHRSTFYAIKLLEKELKTKFVKSGDIGCYTLATYKPLECMDSQLCMGSSIGLANGYVKLQSKKNPVIAIIGDSTFFHTGVPALINAVYNQNNLLVVILDNRSTSMTGFQDNPGTGIKITKERGTRIVIEDLVRGCGVPPENIWVEDSNNLNKLVEKLREALKAQGIRVLISRHLCSLLEEREFRSKQIKIPVVKVDPSKCKGCLICINQFGCPAFTFDSEEKKAFIDQEICRGCKVCISVCPYEAIYEETN